MSFKNTPVSLAIISTLGATILEIMYGIDAQTDGRDRIIELVEKAVHFLSLSATAGAYLGNIL